MSAQQLRTQIEELSSEIALQKKLLKKLEQDKSIAQGQLNAVVDPVARLPLEISSEIFLQCLVPDYTPPQGDRSLRPRPMAGAHYPPMLLLNVCNAWSAIALFTPALWSAIQIDFPCAEGLTQLLPIWFQRAGNRSLSVSLRRDVANLNDPVAEIWRHGGQIKDLDIYNDASDKYGSSDTKIVDFFGYTTPESLPLLHTLKIRIWDGSRLFLGVQILELLRLSPNIMECFSIAWSFRPTLLPTLRQLTFGDAAYSPDSDEFLLNCLTLPALEVLHAAISDRLHDLLKRSSPSLRELSVGQLGREDYPYSLLQECLQLIPTLLRLTVWDPRLGPLAELFAALADSPSLLPNLRSLTIHPWSRSISDSAWWTLLRAVRSRRIQLRILKFEVPPADVLAAFRELVVDGGEIYIGTQKCNFLDSPSEEAT
ncbi:hypothetical protein DFH08DRAFT_1089973 [Mycena albidolilacea]|uniref:F-box domain-containing protein n=1 Tax=Mycena albidolilacea TaxID=1033008 RepID=A0AAD7E7U1_9AGAR|nr:hypothetical protein DFH08DRAFT_1089973 [Mycena albidolilacea]